ncbi:MAG: hypothetical protein Q8S13_00380 [Dehalococcoidia bacterium]|nr:hypothetical protein [Dehalococcoidia bacterium]
MKISQAIAALEALRAAEGDLDMSKYFLNSASGVSFRTANLRRLAGRETKIQYWNSYDTDESKGRLVVIVDGGELAPDGPAEVAPRKPARARKR